MSYYFGRVWFGLFLVLTGKFFIFSFRGGKDYTTQRVIMMVLMWIFLVMSGFYEW